MPDLVREHTLRRCQSRQRKPAFHRLTVRGDYRFIAVNREDTAPSFFGLDQTRYGHRVYGGLLVTFGR